MTSPYSKKSLEAIWNSPKVACPNHFVRWDAISVDGHGQPVYYPKKGRKAYSKRQRKLGSWVFRNYGVYAKFAWAMVAKREGCNCKENHRLPFWHCPYHGEVVVDAD